MRVLDWLGVRTDAGNGFASVGEVGQLSAHVELLGATPGRCCGERMSGA